MDELLFKAARQGHLIITVNDRLARHLSRQYDLAQQAAGHSAWVRAEIMSLTAWLGRKRYDIAESEEILSQNQSLRVWELIVAEDSNRSGNALLQVPQTARRALLAHQLLLRHNVDFRAEEGADDHRAFLRWRSAWRHQAGTHGWRDSAELIWLLSAALADGRIDRPDRVILVGFDELTPDLAHLCKTLGNCGTIVDTWQPTTCNDILCRRAPGLDPADEVRRCARWIRRILTARPGATIGVDAPQLEAYQPLIESIFIEELDPTALVDGDETQQVYNMSLGRGLDHERVVSAAVELLRLGRRLDFACLSRLLRSAYVGGAWHEEPGRALLERELRRAGAVEWSLARLRRSMTGLIRKTGRPLPDFLKIIEVLESDLDRRGQQLPGDWAEHFARLLHRLGWPGDRPLSSREYQAVQQFRGVLSDMASLDRVSKPLTREAAAGILTRLVSSREFQPESADTPVQILGVLESSGLNFDHLWVLGLHDAALPRPPAPNPFIPLALQRRERMQRVDAERELHFALQVAGRLFRAASDVILSWPLQNDAGKLRPSPLIMPYPPGEPPLSESSSPTRLLNGARPELEAVMDCQAPPICSRKPFSGGTGILKDQALCPFRAFARYRLNSEGLEIPEVGVDSMSRGSLAHTVLELFWKETGSQASLLALEDGELERRLADSAAGAIQRFEKEKRSDLPTRQREIEQRRLIALVRQWLETEKKRTDFRVIATEAHHQLAIGNLLIRSRVDRIDALADGQQAIIDYKTGRVDLKQWFDDRVTEPQLPAYSLGFSSEELGAVMFAVVRGKENECGFRGLARNDACWPRNATPAGLGAVFEEKGWYSFDDVLAHWQRALSVLGDAFASGDAAVDPVDRELACTYCDLTPLCRVSERDDVPQGFERDDV